MRCTIRVLYHILFLNNNLLKGNIIKRINDPNDIAESISTYELEYDEHGNLIKQSTYHDGKLIEVTEYEYEEFAEE